MQPHESISTHAASMEVQDDQLDHNADTAAPGANRTSVHMDHTFDMVIDDL